MIYRIADFNFEIESYTSDFPEFAKDYLCNDDVEIDCRITITEQDLIDETKRNLDAGVTTPPSKRFAERGAIQRKVAAFVLSHNTFLMHCAVIEFEGRGYAFTANSGTGKTTHINLWKKKFGDDKVTIINGDKPFFRFIDGKWYAYGTPWNGKEGYGINGRVELCGIAVINRDTDNSIVKLPDDEAVKYAFSQTMISDSTNLLNQLELLDLFLEKVPFYKLNCNMDIQAAEVAYNGMVKGI